MKSLLMTPQLITVTPRLQIADMVTHAMQRSKPFLQPIHDETSFKDGERIHPSFPETVVKHVHGCYGSHNRCFVVSAVTTCAYCEQTNDELCQFKLSIFDGKRLIDDRDDRNAPYYYLMRDYSERFEVEGNDYNRYWLDGAYRQAQLVAYIETTVHTWLEKMRIY